MAVIEILKSLYKFIRMLKGVKKYIWFFLAGAALFGVSAGTLWAQQARADAKAKVNVEESDLEDAKLEDLPGENFSAPWPKTTKIVDMLPARVVEEGGKKNVYETEHFSFTSTAPIQLSAIRDIARIFEGTYTANLALPLNSPCNYYQVAEKGKLKAMLFETRAEYLKAIGSENSNSAGICRSAGTMEDSCIYVPFESLGLEKSGSKYKRGTRKIPAHVLAHELTHFMTLPGHHYPSWYLEGIAEYVGLTDYANGRFSFSGNKKEIGAYISGYGKEGTGGRALGKNINVPMPIEDFMNLPYSEFSKNSQFCYGFSLALAYHFFHVDGKKDAARIKAFIREIQAGKSHAAAYAALLDGRDWGDLEKDVARGLKTLGIRVEFPKRKKKK